MCKNVQKNSAAMKRECKTMKIKNKHQVTMTKGNRSAGGQGSDLPIIDAADGNQGVRSVVTCCDQGNVKADARCPVNSLDLYFILLEFYILFLQVTHTRIRVRV